MFCCRVGCEAAGSLFIRSDVHSDNQISITLFYQARYDYLMNVLRLKQAAGNLQIQDLEEIDQWLKERKTPEQVFAEEAAASSS